MVKTLSLAILAIGMILILNACGGSNLANTGGDPIRSAPAITSFTPATGPRGAKVTITGTNFDPIYGQLSFVGTNGFDWGLMTINSRTSTQITATVPPNIPPGTSGYFIANNSGYSASSSASFMVTSLNPLPAIGNITPAQGVTGYYPGGPTFYQGSAILINGTNFGAYGGWSSYPRVYINRTPVGVYGATDNQIVAIIPQGVTTGPLTVETLDGSGAAVPFTIAGSAWNHYPTISSFSPITGSPGTTVIITGTNFDPIPTNNLVFFCDNLVPTSATKTIQSAVSSATATQLTVTVPSGTNLGNNYILVSSSANGSVWSSQPFAIW